jgi:hypothetical protein
MEELIQFINKEEAIDKDKVSRVILKKLKEQNTKWIVCSSFPENLYIIIKKNPLEFLKYCEGDSSKIFVMLSDLYIKCYLLENKENKFIINMCLERTDIEEYKDLEEESCTQEYIWPHPFPQGEKAIAIKESYYSYESWRSRYYLIKYNDINLIYDITTSMIVGTLGSQNGNFFGLDRIRTEVLEQACYSLKINIDPNLLTQEQINDKCKVFQEMSFDMYMKWYESKIWCKDAVYLASSIEQCNKKHWLTVEELFKQHIKLKLPKKKPIISDVMDWLMENKYDLLCIENINGDGSITERVINNNLKGSKQYLHKMSRKLIDIL